MENQYWHICTDGLDRNLIFTGRSDYISGMNSIPVYALSYDVKVLAFCLMSNHVHFIVSGQEENGVKFIRHYKKRLAVIAGKTAKDDVRRTGIYMKRIDDTEYLMRAIGYVLRNPVPTGQKIMPSRYEWCSADLYFKGYNGACPVGRTVNSLNYRERRKLLGSHIEVPEHYTLSPEGMIYPECYVDSDTVERLFHSPGRLLYRLSRNDDAELELYMMSDILRKVQYQDADLIGSVSSICKTEFCCASLQELSVEQRYGLAGILRKKYGVGIKQIARLTRVDPTVLKRIFNSGRHLK
ncbi:MAG TPA: transposase [Candidatus Coprenecus pullistercoris]|nr:transposase [Candidatus Coprenecus pullistercoris]